MHWTNIHRADFFSQKLISWVFNDQPRRECAVVGLNGSFPAAGGGDLGKKVIAKRIADPAAGLGPIVPMIGPIVSMIGP